MSGANASASVRGATAMAIDVATPRGGADQNCTVAFTRYVRAAAGSTKPSKVVVH